MKKYLILMVLMASTAMAEVTGTDVSNTCGLAQPCGAMIASIGTGSAVMDNNVYAKWRNAADSADLSVLKADASNNTVLNAPTSGSIALAINTTAEATLSNDLFAFSGTAATVQGAGSLILKVDADAQRLFTFDASSDTDLTLTFGDGGTTAAQNLTVKPSTADGDDDAYSCFASGSACSRAGGAYAIFNGNEVASVGGNVEIGTGAGAADTIDFAQGASGLVTARIDGSGLSLPISGDTLLLQEATAGAACMGTLTANGATPVVTSTTCAVTGARIFLTRTSAETGTTDAFISAISTGVSFSITSEAADTGTYNWIIFNEAA